MKHRIVNVTEFKAKCLALLDDVGERGGTITITKRGRPLARVGPPGRPAWKSPEGAWSEESRSRMPCWMPISPVSGKY